MESFVVSARKYRPLGFDEVIGQDHITTTLKNAIANNTLAYLNPPIKNISYEGIAKTATEIKKWFKNSRDVKGDFQTTAVLMERAGTGGSIFRNLYFPRHTCIRVKEEITERYTRG